MPRGGHNKKPTRLHIIEGTARPGRLNKAEPKPTPKAPTCPDWLLPAAKREWHRLAPELERLGLLTIADRGTFAGYVQAWARWRQVEEAIARDGLSVPGHRGIMRKHPLLSTARAYLDALRSFAQEFGLTPAARTHIHAPTAPEGDDESDLD